MRSPDGSDVDSPSPKRSYTGEGLRYVSRFILIDTKTDASYRRRPDSRNFQPRIHGNSRYGPIVPNATESELEYEDDEDEPVSASESRPMYYRSPGPSVESPEPE